MTAPLDTYTFWHAAPDGGPVRATSVVGPAPLDPGTAHEMALAESGLPRARGQQCHRLTYPVVQDVRAVMQRYDNCARCHLCASRMSVAHYRGNPNATIVFLGDGPGREENDMGEPFVGPAGKLQDVLNRNNGLDSAKHVLWMNMLGCRAAANWAADRDPTTAELAACSERVWMMLTAIRPRVVVCMGEVATRYFFSETPNIWSYVRLVPRGNPEDWIMVGYAQHPSYLVRTMGVVSNYRQFAAQRTFYSMLASHLPALTKVNAWRLEPQHVVRQPEVSCHSPS